MNLDKVIYPLRAGEVLRFHTMPSHGRQQSIAEHVFNVWQLCNYMTEGKMSSDMHMAIMTHDLQERGTGDIPHGAKINIPELKEIDNKFEHRVRVELAPYCNPTMFELKILKWADMAECAIYCLDRLYLPEYPLAAEICVKWLRDNHPPTEKAEELRKRILKAFLRNTPVTEVTNESK